MEKFSEKNSIRGAAISFHSGHFRSRASRSPWRMPGSATPSPNPDRHFST